MPTSATSPRAAAGQRTWTEPSQRALLTACGVGVAGFLVLAMLVVFHWSPLATLDVRADNGMRGIAVTHGWLATAGRIVSDIGRPLTVDVLSAVAFIVLLIVRRFRAAAAVAVARLGELGVESAVKALVSRPRPHFQPPLMTATGASFPSGHAAGSAAGYGILLLVFAPLLARRLAILATVLITLLVLAVAASRVVVGVHYPSDVLAGLFLGMAWATGSLALARIRPRSESVAKTG